MPADLPAEYHPVVHGFAWPRKSQHTRRLLMARIAWLLKEDGEFRSNNALRDLRAALEKRGVPTTSQNMVLGVVHDMAAEPLALVEVEAGVKRTLAVRLRPGAELPPNPWDIDREQLLPDEPAPEPEPAPAPEPEPQPAPQPQPAPVAVEVEPPTPAPPAPTPSSGLSRDEKAFLIMKLAGELMVDEVLAPPPAPATDETLERLAAALDRCRALEERVGKAEAKQQAAEDAAASSRKALDAERQARRLIEANLETVMQALRSGKDPRNPTERERLERLMRQRPAS